MDSSGVNSRRVRTQLPTRTPLSAHLKSRVRLLWTRHRSSVLAKLDSGIVREVCTYIAFCPFLTLLSSNGVSVFDTNTLEWRKVALSESLQEMISFMVSTSVGVDQIFLCGGIYRGRKYDLNWKTAFLLDEGRVQQLQSMRWPRFSHAIHFYAPSLCVYMFGGAIPSQDQLASPSCEVFSMVAGTWSLLPDMHVPRANFNVCRNKTKMYICSNGSCEVYDVQSNIFAKLHIADLPNTHCAFTAAWANQLTIVFYGSTWKYDLQAMKIAKVENNTFDLSGSVTEVVVRKGLVYGLYGLDFFCFDLADGRVVLKSR